MRHERRRSGGGHDRGPAAGEGSDGVRGVGEVGDSSSGAELAGSTSGRADGLQRAATKRPVPA